MNMMRTFVVNQAQKLDAKKALYVFESYFCALIWSTKKIEPEFHENLI